jgi:hypothetical protein
MDATITLSDIGTLYTVLISGVSILSERLLNSLCLPIRPIVSTKMLEKFDIGKCFEKLPNFIVSVTIYLTETSHEM